MMHIEMQHVRFIFKLKQPYPQKRSPAKIKWIAGIFRAQAPGLGFPLHTRSMTQIDSVEHDLGLSGDAQHRMAVS